MNPGIPDSVIRKIKRAAKRGEMAGLANDYRTPYFLSCQHFHWQTGTSLIFSRDTGHHSSGWMKNPDFERCYHLSLGFRVVFPDRPAEALGNIQTIVALGGVLPAVAFNNKTAKIWCGLILGEDRRLAWVESPKTAEGKALGIWHYRVFCDEAWQPFLPRGEVYSTEHTEMDWLSYSEIHGDDAPAPSILDPN